MTAWCHLPTNFKQRRALLIAGLGMLCAAFITTLLFSHVSHAVTSTARTINFQGRLLTPSGAVVPDGNYNIQFKIYQGGSGTSTGNPDGTLDWTESHINNGGTSGVEVKAGFFSVTLGSLTPFGSSIDWNQSNLWLSMNVAGSATSCTSFGSGSCVGDGEMLPMKQVTATPYAINAGAVGGKTADDLIQNSTSQQTANFNISGTGMAGILQGGTSVLTPSIDSIGTTLSVGTANATSVTIGSTNGSINIGGGGSTTSFAGQIQSTSSIALQGTMTTPNNNRLYVGGTLASSNTTNQYGVQNSVNFNPQGTSINSIFGSVTTPTITGSSLNVANFTGESIGISTGSGYTGAVGTGTGISVVGPTISGTQLMGLYNGISISSNAANGGNTTGTITNNQLSVKGNTTGAGTGGTVNNYGINLGLSSGTGGTTNNYGLAISGNGGTGSANNWAIYNSSTAANYIQGNVSIGTSSNPSSYALNVSGTANISGNTTVQGAISANSLDTVNASTLSIGSTTASGIAFGNTSANHTNTLYGLTVIKPATNNDSTVAFQLQRADGTAMMTADSLNQTITIGNAISGDKMLISTTTGQVTYYGSARHTKKINLSAEYAGSVLDAGTGSNNTGTMTSGLDLTGRKNYYKWTTNQSTNQSYDIVVQIPLPTDFDGWASSNPLSIDTYTSDTTNGTISLEARDSTNAVRCDFASTSLTPSTTTTWSTNNSACTLNTGTYTAGDYMTLRIRMQSPNGGDVRVGAINLSYLSKY